MQIPFNYIVLDEGGTPILSVPPMDSEKLNMVSAFIFAIEGLSKVLDKESKFHVFYTGHHITVYMRHHNLIFVLITSRDVGENVASRILKDLAETFLEKYGDDPDAIRGALVMGKFDNEEFMELVMDVAERYVNNIKITEEIGFFEDMLQELHERGLIDERLRKFVVLVNVPVLKDPKAVSKEKNEIKKKVMSLCDGSRTIDEIAKKLGLPKIKVMSILTELQRKGVVEIKTKFLFGKI